MWHDLAGFSLLVPMNPIHIEYRQVEALIPYARNAKQHSEAQVAQIAASIREFGWGAPILIDGQNNVIAGHGRLLAARKLGLPEVPVVPLDHLSDTQRRALILADNKIGENASWEDELLGIELADLKDAGFDLGLTGFSQEEWEALIAGEEATKDGLTDEDAVPEVSETPISKTGDVWILGEHKLLCGDATKADDFKVLLGDELVDMTFTDPPYNVNYANTAKDKMRGKNRPIMNDNLGDGFGSFLTDACTNMRSWDACTEHGMFIEQFEGQPCWIGLDLASKTDIAALVAVFRHPEISDAYVTFGKYYLPEDTVNGAGNSQYGGWMHSGRLIVTPGNVIDFGWIESDLLDMATRYEIQAVAFDPFQATQLSTRMLAEGRYTHLHRHRTDEDPGQAGESRRQDRRAQAGQLSGGTGSGVQPGRVASTGPG